MDIESLITSLDATTFASLRRAIEVGKFPDGRRLTDHQRELCMEAVLVWESRNLPPEMRTGYIDRGRKTEGERCAGDDHDHADDRKPLHIHRAR